MSDFADEVVAVLDNIVNETEDQKRQAIESPELKPYSSGLHDGDPDEQPSQDKVRQQ